MTKLAVLEGRAILGTASGSVHLLDLATGRALAAPSSLDHMDAVTGVGPSAHLQHFVTGSRDSHVKVGQLRSLWCFVVDVCGYSMCWVPVCLLPDAVQLDLVHCCCIILCQHCAAIKCQSA